MSQIPADSSSPLEPHAPHREADDQEEIYFQGSPLVRGNLGKIFLWTLLGLLLIAAPIAYYFLSNPRHWPIWWATLACVVVGLILLFIPVLIVKSVRYRISNYRIDYERG